MNQHTEKEKTVPMPTPAEAREKLKELIQGIEVAMFTTVDASRKMKSRPMMAQEMDENGCIWFFTAKQNHVVSDVEECSEVNLAFASPDNSQYVSVSGTAEVVDDRAKAKELWSPLHHAWYPNGLEDPELVLLKFKAEEGDYWDAPVGKMIQFFRIAKAAITREGYKPMKGEHGNVSLH